MLTLYPAIRAYQEHRIAVGDGHELYVEESGEPDGIPVLFVHGGPGAGCDRDNRRFFDPSVFRIILFDQRGCGRSTPHGGLEHNTSQHLVADIEMIRQQLNVDKWILFGGSWGSTLSLLYAQAHPGRVSGLILRGIFLAREQDTQWLYHDGARHIFPDYWEDFERLIPVDERDDMVAAYYKRLTGQDELLRMGTAKEWAMWEGRCATLDPNPRLVEEFSEAKKAYAFSRICCHYFQHKCFIEENQILGNIERLQTIPGVIVQGRYDIICPLSGALALHHAWPRSQLNIIRDAGHAASEPGTVDALVRATQAMARRHNAA